MALATIDVTAEYSFGIKLRDKIEGEYKHDVESDDIIYRSFTYQVTGSSRGERRPEECPDAFADAEAKLMVEVSNTEDRFSRTGHIVVEKKLVKLVKPSCKIHE